MARWLASLGQLAATFRGTRDSAQRRNIAADYAKTVARLIAGGYWNERGC